jgi:hypothetical protein
VENDEKQAPMDDPELNPPEEDGFGDGYPLRPPDQDPRWAVNTVRIWLGIALFSLAFILVLMILGIFHD